MPDELAAFLVALAVSIGATALAIRVGLRYGLVDHPEGWKRHARATPYVGGAAVMAAFLAGALTSAGDLSRFWPLLALALVIGAVGMIDDHRRVPASVRVMLEIGAATCLWSADLGWTVFASDAADLALTIVWVVALVNAINLLDLMDGVAGTVAAVSAAGIGALASIEGDPILAAIAFALSGACAGFLTQNLRSPARIYLGDGGTMAIGLVVAATTASLPLEASSGWIVLAGVVPLFGVPLFDMGLRIFLRRRRGITLMTAGRDSVANYLEARLDSPRRVACALGAIQAVLCALAIGALRLGDEATVSFAVIFGVVALLAAGVVATSAWAREGWKLAEVAG